MTLTKRQERILEGVCQEFIKRAQPISSQFLKEKQNLEFSPATIRNEFVALERKNYLFHPFISSGRIPTDRGYRFFVNKILATTPFQFKRKKDITEIKEELQKLKDILMLSRQVAKALSSFSSNLALTYLFRENIFWKEGWQEVAREPEFQDINYWRQFIEMTADFERNIDNFECSGEIKIYIGKESPLRSKNFSIIVTETPFPRKNRNQSTAQRGLVALLGPKRMDFERNIALISEVVEILKKLS
ncbi:hypothetical protein J7K44_02585 [bacterium]|nr:hypothetical protein [bacterium]